MHGEPAELFFRQRKTRLRPLILILDVSGSMADYSRNLLQFAHSAKRSAGRVEVFCFGTRLTRVTGAMEVRRPDEALERAARAAFDWAGGTRIGDSLDAFVRGWARRGLCRGGIVVVCSDGLDRGDPAVLAAAKDMLRRGLVEGTAGNISARREDGNLVITPSSVDYADMTLDDLVLVDPEGAVLHAAASLAANPNIERTAEFVQRTVMGGERSADDIVILVVQVDAVRRIYQSTTTLPSPALAPP